MSRPECCESGGRANTDGQVTRRTSHGHATFRMATAGCVADHCPPPPTAAHLQLLGTHGALLIPEPWISRDSKHGHPNSDVTRRLVGSDS